MNVNDAMNILNLSGTVTQKEIKAAYKKASLTFHPDRNSAGSEMMKVINEAYSTLKAFGNDSVTNTSDNFCNYGEVLNEKLNAFFDLNLDDLIVELCGNWIWITGNTKPYSKLLGKNGIGFYYASKKKAWYFRPEDYKSFNRKEMSLDEIRINHGSSSVQRRTRKELAA
ncbi:DnaJ domain-containing protein [Photobacterium damselae]|uniref:DnaJ domain-containing protein n=1 Tax=Photobacterium damselae TaxID=38293 RepID=UPI0010FE4E7C|nr:DnaJ domain-containing protein [Photobacterium damselae]TLS69670.1 J domain-containing protein [Photobacterium damselae subsp. damselae]